MAHAAFNWQDTFLLDLQLSDDERMVRDAAAAYSQDKLLPRVTQAFREGSTAPAIPDTYGGPGLVILGKQAMDDDCNQTGQMLVIMARIGGCAINHFCQVP